MTLKTKLPLLITLIIVMVLVLNHLNDGQKLLAILKQANPWLIAAALVTEGIYYVFFSRLHQQALKLYQIDWRLSEVIPPVFAGILVNLIAPFGPLASVTVFAKKVKAQGASRLNATAALFMVALIDLLGLLFFLIISLILLFFKHELLPVEIIAALTLLLMISGLVLLLSGVGFTWLGRLPLKWIKQQLTYWRELAEELKLKRRQVMTILPSGLLIHLINLTVVGLIILAYHQSVGLVNLMVIYSLLILFIVVVPTPQGLGVVETLMPVILHSWGLEIEAGTLIILTFRGISLWLPASLGVLSFPWVFRKKT